MRSRQLVAIAILVLASPGLARAQPTRTVEKVVSPGRTQKVAYFTALDPTCHSNGRLAVNLIEPPHSGRVEVYVASEYPNYPTFNSRATCNTRKVPATVVGYGAAPGAREDEFVLEVVDFVGTPHRTRYHVTIR